MSLQTLCCCCGPLSSHLSSGSGRDLRGRRSLPHVRFLLGVSSVGLRQQGENETDKYYSKRKGSPQGLASILLQTARLPWVNGEGGSNRPNTVQIGGRLPSSYSDSDGRAPAGMRPVLLQKCVHLDLIRTASDCPPVNGKQKNTRPPDHTNLTNRYRSFGVCGAGSPWGFPANTSNVMSSPRDPQKDHQGANSPIQTHKVSLIGYKLRQGPHPAS